MNLDSVHFKPHQIYTRPISVETKTGHVIFRPDRGPDTLADSIQPVYRQTGDVNPIVMVDYIVPATAEPITSVKAQLKYGGITNNAAVWYSGNLAPGQVVQLALQADDPDVANLKTGHYNFEVEITEYSGEVAGDPHSIDGTHELVNRRDSEFGVGWWLDSLDRIITGAGSYYGNYEGGGNGVLLARGDGTAGWFAEAGVVDGKMTYTSPAGSFTTLVKNADGTFTLTHPDGTKDDFKTDGWLESRTDRNGNVIRYEYDQTKLSKIIDIYGLETNYTYVNGRLTKVTDFAGRETLYTLAQLGTTEGKDQGYYVTAITEPDPDGAETQYVSPVTNLTWHVSGASDGSPSVGGESVNENPTSASSKHKGLLKKITTPGIETATGETRPVTVLTYDAAGRFHQAKNGDDTYWRHVSQEVSLLPGITRADGDPNAAGTQQAPVVIGANYILQAAYTNERGTATMGYYDQTDFQWRYTLDRFGYEIQLTDPLGVATTGKERQYAPGDFTWQDDFTWNYVRNSDGLMTRKIEPKGAGGVANFDHTLTTFYTYGPAGTLLAVIYPQATASTTDAASAMITETWEYYGADEFYQLKQHKDPRGYVADYVLTSNGANTAEVRQQVDLGSTDYQQDKADPTKWVTTKFEYTPSWTESTPRNLPGGLVTTVIEAYASADAVETFHEYYEAGATGNQFGLLKVTGTAPNTAAEQTSYYTYDANRNPNIVTNDPFLLGEALESKGVWARTTTYAYDDLDRLVSETGLETSQHAASTVIFAYDDDGNQTFRNSLAA